MAITDKLKAIANAIRSKTGKTKVMTLDEMPIEIESIEADSGEPREYEKIDYIQFTGTQAVDTGIVCTQDTRIKVLFTRDDDVQRYLYGVLSTGNTASVTAYLTSGSGNWRFGNRTMIRGIVAREEIVHTSIIDKTGITGNTGTGDYDTVSNFTSIGSLILGSARNTDGSIDTNLMLVGKVFRFEMWSGEELVLQLIPVITKSGEYGFWDTVTKSIKTSITNVSLRGGML